MSLEESEKLTKENLEWLRSLVPTLPDLSFLEPTIQTLALINQANQLSTDTMVVMAVAGFIATKARTVNEKRFQEVQPGDYIQHAYILLKVSRNEAPTEGDYLYLIQKLYK
jgi:hypothetical protein